LTYEHASGDKYAYLCQFVDSTEPSENATDEDSQPWWWTPVGDRDRDYYNRAIKMYYFAPQYWTDIYPDEGDPIFLPVNKHYRSVGFCADPFDINCENCDRVIDTEISESPFAYITGMELNWNPKHFIDDTIINDYSGLGLNTFISDLTISDFFNDNLEEFGELVNDYTMVQNHENTSFWHGGLAIQNTPNFNPNYEDGSNYGQITWDWNPLTNCYGIENNNNEVLNPSDSNLGQVLKFLSFDSWVSTSPVNYDTINQSSEGLKLFTFRFKIPIQPEFDNTPEMLAQLDDVTTKQKFANFLNSFGCFQTNNLVGFIYPGSYQQYELDSDFWGEAQQSIYFKYEPKPY